MRFTSKVSKGFTLSEVLIAMGVLMVAVLSVAAISFSALASSQKNSDSQTGTLLARQVLETSIEDARKNLTAPFWGQNSAATAYQTDTIQVGNTPFHCQVFVTDVNVAADPDLGTTPAFPLKRVDVVVDWWDQPNQSRAGFGKLSTRTYRVVSRG